MSKVNAILLSLTNRDTGYVSNELQIFQDFQPSVESNDEKTVRELLGLKDETTDYFVKGALGSVEAFSAVRERFDEEGRTYDLARLQRPPESLSGGILVPDSMGFPQIIRHPVEWPAAQSMEFTWLDARTLKLEIGGRTYYAPYHQDPDGIYTVSWPAVSGIRGRLQPDAVIETGYTFTVSHEPLSYPFGIVATRLKNSVACLNLLQTQGLTKAWYAADSDAERVAVGLLALGLSNKSIYA
jgi:hypothetical protein